MLKKILTIIVKILEWVTFLVLLLFFLISASAILPFKKMPKLYVVTTGSMIPTIMPGSVSLVLPTDTKTIKQNDIIAFKTVEDTKTTIIHRVNEVVSTDPLKVKTKGDNNKSPDTWETLGDSIIGRHLFSVPYLGYVGSYIRKPIGFGLLIILPALIFILLQVFSIKKSIEEEVNKRIEDKIKKSNSTGAMNSIIMLVSVTSIFSLYSLKSATALFQDSVDVSNLAISVKDFVAPPVPTLISPEDEDLLNTSGLVMRWDAVSDYEDMHNPVYYRYQRALNSSFSPLAYGSGKLTSTFIPASGTPDGTYWWRVKACDSIDNCSDWSEEWKVDIDSTGPVVDFTNIEDGDEVDGKIDIKGTVTDAHPDHYWLVIQDSDKHTVAGPGNVNDTTSFTDKKLMTWDTTEVENGEYTIKLEARDEVGNKDSKKSVKWIKVTVNNEEPEGKSSLLKLAPKLDVDAKVPESTESQQ